MAKTLAKHAGMRSSGMGSAALTRIAESPYMMLASRAGLTLLSVGVLSQQDTTVGKVAFGLSTAVFGFLTLAKAFEL